MSKQNIIKGTLILTITGILTKLLGFYNRIFLTRLIGVKELGLYQLIFPIYLLAFSITVSGFQTALTKQISYYIGRKNYTDSKKVLGYSIIISLILSLLTTILIFEFSAPICTYIIINSSCAMLLKLISIAIPFVSLKACLNSYFIGINKPVYHGVAHLIEQLVRIFVAYLLSIMVYEDKINASHAVIAVVIGEISATLFSVIVFLNISKDWLLKLKKPISMLIKKYDSFVAVNLFRDVGPVTLNQVMLTLFSSLEAVLMPAMLYKFYRNPDTAIEVFGIITGIVIPFLFFPSTITSSLSTMLLPAVSYSNAKNDAVTIKNTLKNSTLFCCALGIFSWIFFLIFGRIVCELFFNNQQAGLLLQKTAFLCPLIYLSGNLSAILNGLDKAFLNLIFHVVSIVIRILFIIILVPRKGIDAYIEGMLISYVVLDFLMILKCNKSSKHTLTRFT